jgi:hypothetical protein
MGTADRDQAQSGPHPPHFRIPCQLTVTVQTCVTEESDDCILIAHTHRLTRLVEEVEATKRQRKEWQIREDEKKRMQARLFMAGFVVVDSMWLAG